MYECTYPFWAIVFFVAVCFALAIGFDNVYIPISNIPSPETAKQRLVNNYLEISAKEKISTHIIAYIFIGLSMLTSILFLWQYFSIHPIAANFLSILSCIGILAITIIIMLLLVASLLLLSYVATSIHMRIFTKKFSRLYDTENVYITLSYGQ